jgi:hypothetical protein
MGRPDGAKVWARVLSELADVPVAVEWERPSWRVRWCDGPTQGVLMERAAALGRYRVGAPLGFEQLRFIRSSSAASLALGWLARGSPAASSNPAEDASLVEAWCEDTGYPESRFDELVVAAADLLCRVGRGDTAEMGNLIARAVPPVPPQVPTETGPELTGRVTSLRWPAGGPPAELLGLCGAHRQEQSGVEAAAILCGWCGTAIPGGGSGRGRPARYCSGRCRVAAHRAHHREHVDAAARP